MLNIEKMHHSIAGALRVLRKPPYLFLAIIVACLFAFLIFLVINIKFYGSLLFSSLPLMDKISVLGAIFYDLIMSVPKNTNGILLAIVAILQGISIAILVYVMNRNRHDHKITPTRVGLNGVAAIAAAIGLGCVPCGTSLILPIVMLFFSGSAIALAADIASGVILGIALLLSIYSIYKSGSIAYMHVEFEKNSYDDQGERAE